MLQTVFRRTWSVIIQSISFFAADKERKLFCLLEPLGSGHGGLKKYLTLKAVVTTFTGVSFSTFTGPSKHFLVFFRQHRKHKLISHHFFILPGKLIHNIMELINWNAAWSSVDHSLLLILSWEFVVIILNRYHIKTMLCSEKPLKCIFPTCLAW